MARLTRTGSLTRGYLAITAALASTLCLTPLSSSANADKGPMEVLDRGLLNPDPASWIAGNSGFLAFGEGRRVSFIENPGTEVRLGSYEADSEVTSGVVLGNRLLLGRLDSGFAVLDVSDPHNPVETDRVRLPGGRFLLAAEADFLAVLSETEGLFLYRATGDAASGSAEFLEVSFLPIRGEAHSVAILDGRVLVSLAGGQLISVNAEDSAEGPHVESLPTPEPLLALAPSGDALLAAGATGATWLFDPATSTFGRIPGAPLPRITAFHAEGRALYAAGPGGVRRLRAGREEATTYTVRVGNVFFNPDSVTLAPGDTVHWTWVGGTHSTTSGTCAGGNCTPDGLWDSGTKSSGSFDRVFGDPAGEYPYFCRVHESSQTGVVRVEASQCTLECTATASPTSGQAPLSVNFTSTADDHQCDGTVAYHWDFGDGTSSDLQNASHTYSDGGTYSWFFSASIQDQVCTETGSITVTQSPVCTLTCTASATPSSGQAPLAVSFAATADALNCTGAITYAWGFGDGTTSAERNPTHTYQSAGSYAWSLTVTVDGQTCSQTGSVLVTQPPGCGLSCQADATPLSGTAPLTVGFTATATASNCAGTPAYAWNFGDGATSVAQNPTHTYLAAGTYAWTLTVSVDDQTCVATGSVSAFGTGPKPGDCSGDGTVSIGEVQQSINMFLGLQATACGTDCSGDGTVSIGEVQKVINAFLGLPSAC